MVTFKTNNYRHVQMITGDAHTLLGLMGVGTKVPGALRSENVPAALERLKQAIAHHEERLAAQEDDNGDEDEEDEESVPLKTRAFPLIELLSTAAESNDYVMWE